MRKFQQSFDVEIFQYRNSSNRSMLWLVRTEISAIVPWRDFSVRKFPASHIKHPIIIINKSGPRAFFKGPLGWSMGSGSPLGPWPRGVPWGITHVRYPMLNPSCGIPHGGYPLTPHLLDHHTCPLQAISEFAPDLFFKFVHPIIVCKITHTHTHCTHNTFYAETIFVNGKYFGNI